MASEVLISISKDDVERARLMSEYKYEVDTQSRLVHARKEGERIGEKIGEKRTQLTIARNLRNSGLSAEQIAMATGLTREQIEKL